MPQIASMWSRPRLLVPTTARRTRLAGLGGGSALSHEGRVADRPRPRPAAVPVFMNSRRLVALLMGLEWSAAWDEWRVHLTREGPQGPRACTRRTGLSREWGRPPRPRTRARPGTGSRPG